MVKGLNSKDEHKVSDSLQRADLLINKDVEVVDGIVTKTGIYSIIDLLLKNKTNSLLKYLVNHQYRNMKKEKSTRNNQLIPVVMLLEQSKKLL